MRKEGVSPWVRGVAESDLVVFSYAQAGTSWIPASPLHSGHGSACSALGVLPSTSDRLTVHSRSPRLSRILTMLANQVFAGQEGKLKLMADSGGKRCVGLLLMSEPRSSKRSVSSCCYTNHLVGDKRKGYDATRARCEIAIARDTSGTTSPIGCRPQCTQARYGRRQARRIASTGPEARRTEVCTA